MSSNKRSKKEAEDYAQWTDENVKAREEFFASLNVDKIASDLRDLSSSGTKTNQTRYISHKAKSEVEPPRRSMRLQGKPTVSMNEEEIVAAVAMAEEKRRQATRVETIDAGKCKREDYTDDKTIQAFRRILNDLSAESYRKSVKTELTVHSDFAVKSVAVSKVCQERAYSLAIQPSSSTIIYAVGDVQGGVGLHCETLSIERCEFAPHGGRPVTHLAFDKCHLVSSGYDGTLRSLDLERDDLKFRLLFSADGDVGITSVDLPPENCLLSGDIWLSQTDGTIVRVDGRLEPGKSAVGTYRVNPKHCRTVSTSAEKHIICTSGRDGVIALWDSRFMSEVDSPHPKKPIATSVHPSSVSSAYLHPNDPSLILSTSFDNTIRISRYEGNDCKVLLSLSHNNNTGRFLTPFRAVWHPSGEYLFGIGSLQRPRRVQLFSATEKTFPRFSCNDLYHDLISSVQSILAFHKSLPLVVGVNSSGRTHAIHLKN